MAVHSNPIINWSQYLALRSLSGFMHCFSVQQNLRTAATVGSIFFHSNRKRRARAELNLALSFPEWPAERVSTVARRSMEHMFQMFLVDALVMPRLVTPGSWPKFIKLGNISRVQERLIRGDSMLFLTGHCGNWELLGYYLAMLGMPIHALARPIDNPLINDWLLGIREARGMKIITKWGASTVLQKVLDDNGRLGFIADQNAGEQGLFVPFFGRLASSYKSIGLLAMRYNVPVVAGLAKRLRGRFEYELHIADIIDPDDWVDQPDPLFYITARYNRAMEEMIRKAPDQYLWIHRRWKSRPKHERQGKSIPKRMIEKLEQLPWMTTDELNLIVERSNAAATGKLQLTAN